MKKLFKKGFTLLELVIVVAVISILASILIPVFINLSNKANIASDESLVRTLNTALAMKEGEIDDKKNQNPTDMVEDLRFEGYDLETLLKRQKSDKTILYNLPKNRFLFSENTGNAEFSGSLPHDFWEFRNDATFNAAGYSLYLCNEYQGGDITSLSTGLDTGINDEEFDITYMTDSDKTVVIRTNNGTLTINAQDANVKHYGKAEVLIINNVDINSYHEFGQIVNAQIKRGHIVIENSEASIDKLLLIAKSQSEGFDKIGIEAKSGATLPELDRTKVDIAENGTKVCDVTVNNDKNAIWLYSNGIYENIKIADSTATSVSASSEGAPAKSTPLGKASYEIANAALRNDSDVLVDELGNEVTVEEAVVIQKDTPSEEEIETGTTLFAGGLGTEANPYLISRVSHFGNIAGELTNKNYLLTKDFDFKVEDLGNNLYLINEFDGTIDGGSFRIKLPYFPTDKNTYPCFINTLNGTVKNMDFEIDNNGVLVKECTTGATFENIDAYGDVILNGTNYGAYLDKNSALNVNFVNCDFYGTISAGGTKGDNTAIYVGFNVKPSDPSTQTVTLSFTDCDNFGTVISGDAAMFVGNTGQINYTGTHAYLLLDINNCRNNGVIEWVDTTFYRPYNHFVASNLQEVKEIDIDGVRYIKTVNMSEEQKTAAGINGTTIKEMEQVNSTHPQSLWDKTRLYQHTAPIMPDNNGRNYVAVLPDATLNLYLTEDNEFRIYEAHADNVSYYEVTNKTYVHYNGASQIYTIVERVNADQFVDGKYTTTMKNYSFVDARWINDENHPERLGGEFGTITINGVDYPTYTINNETKYFYDDHGTGFYFAGDAYRNHPGSVYVSAYDANGKIIASAKLSEDPEPTEVLPEWYVAYNPDTMTNLVETGTSSTNVSVLFNQDNPAMLVQGKYCSQTPGTGPYYEGSGGTSDYITGCIKMEGITNDTYIFIRTKSLLNNDHDRMFIGHSTSDTSRVYSYGWKAVSFKSYGLSNIDEYIDGDYRVYRINVNDFYTTKIKTDASDPTTLADSNYDVYIRISVYGANVGDTIVYTA